MMSDFRKHVCACVSNHFLSLSISILDYKIRKVTLQESEVGIFYIKKVNSKGGLERENDTFRILKFEKCKI